MTLEVLTIFALCIPSVLMAFSSSPLSTKRENGTKLITIHPNPEKTDTGSGLICYTCEGTRCLDPFNKTKMNTWHVCKGGTCIKMHHENKITRTCGIKTITCREMEKLALLKGMEDTFGCHECEKNLCNGERKLQTILYMILPVLCKITIK
ncbi:uncharacterized protein [Periplaneta americana]|uniref:uncharacterized protein n=1 Tax=Periplaneta americana TaxID=6978 RepID=UPI0037E777DD